MHNGIARHYITSACVNDGPSTCNYNSLYPYLPCLYWIGYDVLDTFPDTEVTAKMYVLPTSSSIPVTTVELMYGSS